jgi:galactokinase
VTAPVEPARPLSEKAEAAATRFTPWHGKPPTWLACAPGRINLIGEHVDYNDGLVLPMAIDWHVVAAAAPVPEPRVRVLSAAVEQEVVISLEEPLRPTPPAWSNYVRGVIHRFRARGATVSGLDLLIDSDLPLGGGLSSSAALEVATATLLEAVCGLRLDPVEKALLARRAEHDFAGVPCGIMDQFAAVLGRRDHLLLLDCRSQEVQQVPMTDPAVTVLIVNTNVRHELSSGEYAVRLEQCRRAAEALGVRSLRDVSAAQLEAHRAALDAILYRRARHVVTEIERTAQAAEAVGRGDWAALGERMYASHASLRDDYEVSCAELDLVVEVAQELGTAGGVYGCRMTGGGFGGCTVSLVRTAALADAARVIRARYEAATRVVPTLFASRPADGAAVLHPAPLTAG